MTVDETPRTRPSLLLRLRGERDERDERAWAEFLVLYEPLVLRLMRRRGLQESDARDTTQQVLLRVSGAIERYQPDGVEASFRRWLFRVARNVVVTFLMRQLRQPKLLDDRQIAEVLDATLAASAESDLFDHEYRQQVLAWATEQVRREFRDTTWQAFVETNINGRPIAEVASELSLSPGSVYVARSRIIARLRAKVEEFEAED
ncbi:MAG: sigma-70 family RNA polymerase sigma factor [Planctomycetota bacterium]|nr:MAG: sigma-70 family RNA polymerase sigma factor [Planctomycetota bacterium]